MNLLELLRRQRDGFSLEQPLYTDSGIFEREVEAILGQEWLLVDHESRIPEPGDYFLFNVAGESLIVVRAETREVNALFNVCRHRGSRILETNDGRLNRIACGYHGWTYELDGRLKKWRHMPDGLSPENFGLASAHVRIVEGLIFVSLKPGDPPDFEGIHALVTPLLQAHGIAEARVAHRETYLIGGNWKLALENFHECYHCPSSHPQYTRVYAYVGAQERVDQDSASDFEALTTEWRAQARRLNESVPDAPDDAHRAPSGGRVYRAPIRRGYQTGTEDGRPVAPLMGKFEQYDGGHTGVIFNYLSGLAGYGDYAITIRFIPLDASTTDATICWLVRGDAEEGRDYDKGRLLWLWDVTTRQDKEIIERNARGVSSRRYVPGPYSELEVETRAFSRWYLSRMVNAHRDVGQVD